MQSPLVFGVGGTSKIDVFNDCFNDYERIRQTFRNFADVGHSCIAILSRPLPSLMA